MKNQRPTLLFLHGWGASSQSFAHIKPIFEARYECVFIDFDCNPAREIKLEDYVEVVESKIIEHKITHCHIVAHSFGARVAVLLALRNPNIVRKMVITGGAGLKPKFNLATFFKIRAHKIFGHGLGSPDYRILSPTGKRTFQNIIHRNLKYEISRVRNSTLLLYGKRDTATPIYMAKRWKKLQPNSRLKIYLHCGHFAFLDRPAKFCHDVMTFLEDR